MQDEDIILKRGEMSEPLRIIDPIYYQYPCAETSGALYAHLLNKSLLYLFDRNTYSGLRVLDIGCGYGWVAEAFAKRNAKACAVDINRNLCSFSNSRFKKKGLDVMVVCCDCEKMPFKSQAFDVGTFNASLHHLPQPAKGLEEALRISNSLYIINEPRQVVAINSVIDFFSKVFKKNKQYCAKAGQQYDSVMDKPVNEQRFNLNELTSLLKRKGCTIHSKRYWCYAPPLLQKTNNLFIVALWKRGIEIMNFTLPYFGHTFFLRADKQGKHIEA